MKWVSFFLLLFLVPSFAFTGNFNKHYDKAGDEWNLANQLIEQSIALDHSQVDTKLHLLNQAIESLNRALSNCDALLKKIHKTELKEKKSLFRAFHNNHPHWRNKLKEEGKELRTACREKIAHLYAVQHEFASTMQLEAKTKSLYEECLQNIQAAEKKYQTLPHDLTSIESSIAILNETADLYEKATSLARQASQCSPHPQDRVLLQQTVQACEAAAAKCREEALALPNVVREQITTLKMKLQLLEEEKVVFEEKGLKRSAFQVLQQMLPLLETLVAIEEAEPEALAKLKNAIVLFERDRDQNRFTPEEKTLSSEAFKAREEERREVFYEQLLSDTEEFNLYAEQFHRFLTPGYGSQLHIQVYEQGQCIDEEFIPLPQQKTLIWERYLTEEGKLFIPETRLKTQYGLDLRISVLCDPKGDPLLLTAIKTLYPQYTFIFSSEEQGVLFASRSVPPPPWQLASSSKPNKNSSKFTRLSTELDIIHIPSKLQSCNALCEVFPLINEFVEELKKDPLAIAAYIANEIAFTDPFLISDQGTFFPPVIHRSPLATFLEKQGSPWEQCQLLVYALRTAGYQALYREGLCQLPKNFVENLLFTQLPDEQQEVLLNYPGVLFFDGKEWIPLFPWMKEMQVVEGDDLYSLLPDSYASADRWILQYLKGNEQLLKHIRSEEDDSLGTLFVRFVEEELQKQGLGLNDVGVQHIQVKKQFTSWEQFPSPILVGQWQSMEELEENRFVTAHIEISSHENPEKKYVCVNIR